VTYTVLFLCTGNSARSIMAEALLRARGAGRFRALSAGSHPKGEVHPLALETLAAARMPTAGLRSKGWNDFSGADAPPLDFVITVCGNAARETCPVWPGHPITAHWEIDDPASAVGTAEEKAQAFRRAYVELDRRIGLLVSLPVEKLDRPTLEQRLRGLGQDRVRPAGRPGR
jgi:protein-tyrosine-phosphatase